MWAIETERARCHFWQANSTIDASSLFGKENLLTINNRDQNHSIAELERGLQRVTQALTKRWINLFLDLCLFSYPIDVGGIDFVKCRVFSYMLKRWAL